MTVEGGVGEKIVNGSVGRGGQRPRQSPGFCLSLSSPSHVAILILVFRSLSSSFKVSASAFAFPLSRCAPFLYLIPPAANPPISHTGPPTPSCTRTVARTHTSTLLPP